MAWCQFNDKHIYVKNGIDNRHMYVSLGLHELTLSQKISSEGHIDWSLFYCKISKSENGLNNFHLAAKY